LWRSTDCDEYDLTPANAFREVRREVEPMRPISLEEIGQTRLEERNLASTKLGELVLVHVDTRDVSA
jgi:hypothetical protein